MTDTTPTYITLNDKGFAIASGNIIIYNYDKMGCYISTQTIFLNIGTGIPANSTIVAPPAAVTGDIAVFNTSTNTWTMEEDHRGETWYLISTGYPVVIDFPGVIDATKYSSTPIAKSEYIINQANNEMGWITNQSSLAMVLGETFTADMKTYVTTIRSIQAGTSTLTALPERPASTDIMS